MATDTPVLILDDDPEFLGALADGLSEAGFNPTQAATVAEAEALVLRGPIRFEAVLLDVDLPDGDGRDLCARLRKAGLRVPVIMLTGSDGEEDIVRGLESGAHDYVAKPCRPGVLIARLRTQLRLHENSMDAVFNLGPWQFHPAQKLLRNERGVKVWLTAKEVDILRHLQRNGGTVSKQALLSEVWGYNPSVSSHTLETHIYRLRQKIEADPYAARLLLTAEGGYRLAPEQVAA
ncbi:MAG TPA: response regulator transcription factor [Acetobacteraceae bacterium]